MSDERGQEGIRVFTESFVLASVVLDGACGSDENVPRTYFADPH
jgi:hypothetical protein